MPTVGHLVEHQGSKGGRPPALDSQMYPERVDQRSFALIRQWRGLAARYDKLAITYRAAVVLSACLVWTRLLGETP